MNPALQILNVGKTFKDTHTPAVFDATFSVSPGKILGLLGESGCGKTTLLRMIAGFETPDTGTITIANDLVVSDKINIQPGKRNIGMIFQDFALFPHLNVLDNILFGVTSKNKSERSAIAKKMLALTNLSGFEKRFPRELSGGQQQRLALARCLATAPQLILLDEPFSNLDLTLRKQVRKQIGELLKLSNASAVIVTHDIEDAVALCDEIAIMKEGVVLQIGTYNDLYQNPKSEYVASITGDVLNITPLVNVNLLNIKNSGSAIFIRPQHLKIVSDNGKIAAKVLNSKFIGKGYDYLLKSDNFEFTITLPDPIQLGTIINLDFDTNELLQF